MNMPLQNKRLPVIFLIIVFLLVVPLIAMLFTKEVNWTFSDFVIAGLLLTGTGLSCELVMRTVKKTGYRIAVCATIFCVLVLVWLELAVGIFGTAFAGN